MPIARHQQLIATIHANGRRVIRVCLKQDRVRVRIHSSPGEEPHPTVSGESLRYEMVSLNTQIASDRECIKAGAFPNDRIGLLLGVLDYCQAQLKAKTLMTIDLARAKQVCLEEDKRSFKRFDYALSLFNEARAKSAQTDTFMRSRTLSVSYVKAAVDTIFEIARELGDCSHSLEQLNGCAVNSASRMNLRSGWVNSTNSLCATGQRVRAS